MKITLTLSALLICHSLLGMLQAKQASEQIKNEIANLERIVASRFNTDKESKKAGKEYLAELTIIKSLIESDHLYWGLSRLKTPFTNIKAIYYLRDKTGISEEGQEAFDSEWLRIGEYLAEKSEMLAITQSTLPMAVKAIAESALNQSQPYYHSSRLYSQNTSINSGLYYLGRAKANLDYALFCQTLRFEQAPFSPKPASLEPELAELEGRVVAGYQEAGFGSAEKEKTYNRFIFANMTIKMVREMERAGFVHGALYKYLEALLNYELIEGPVVNIRQLESLREKSAQAAERLSSNRIDHSIGLIFWQMARVNLDASNFDGDSLKECARILDSVLPKYFEIIEWRYQQ